MSTNSDNELRAKLEQIILDAIDETEYGTMLLDIKEMKAEEILGLFAAHTAKEVEEARIDELIKVDPYIDPEFRTLFEKQVATLRKQTKGGDTNEKA